MDTYTIVNVNIYVIIVNTQQQRQHMNTFYGFGNMFTYVNYTYSLLQAK